MLVYSKYAIAVLLQSDRPISGLFQSGELTHVAKVGYTAVSVPSDSDYCGTGVAYLAKMGKVFAPDSVTISVSNSHSVVNVTVGSNTTTITGSTGTVTAYKGEPVIVSGTPATGYENCTLSLGATAKTNPFTFVPTANASVSASSTSVPVITATVGEHGTLKLGSYTITTGSNSIPCGDYTWTATYDEGYELDTFTVDGESVDIPSEISLAQNHTVVFSTKTSE